MKTNYKRTITFLIASALFAFFGTSCGTVNGFGHDVQHVGGEIKEASR